MIRFFSVVVFIVSLSGCELISISEDVSYGSDGRAVPKATLNKIELGSTNRIWVEKALGKPDSVETAKGLTTLQYQFSEQIAQRFRVFLLFQYKGSIIRERILYVQLKEDLVQKAWLEGDALLEPIEFGTP